MNRLLQVLLALTPLLATSLLAYALAEDWLSLGGDDKDVLLALPWMIWALLFALCGFVLIYRRWSVRRWLTRSSLVSVGVLFGVWSIALGLSLLGWV